MQPPDELMVQSFLPSVRQLVALRLRSQGLSQNRISSLLGVTQASVSMYLAAKPEKAYSALSDLGVSRREAERVSSLLASASEGGAAEGVRALHAVWTGLLGAGSVCPAHRSLYPSLSDCDVCIREYGQGRGARSQAVAEVEEAVRLLEGSPDFVDVIPEVSVNIACAAGDARTPEDVVAVPGRIVRLKDRAKALLPPEAGASAHMSRVLILARKRRPDLRACINLRFDDRMASVMKKAHLRSVPIGRYNFPRSHDPTAEAMERALKAHRADFDAVVDEGGSGIEPNVYLFAKSARGAAELALRLASSYSAAE